MTTFQREIQNPSFITSAWHLYFLCPSMESLFDSHRPDGFELADRRRLYPELPELFRRAEDDACFYCSLLPYMTVALFEEYELWFF